MFLQMLGHGNSDGPEGVTLSLKNKGKSHPLHTATPTIQHSYTHYMQCHMCVIDN